MATELAVINTARRPLEISRRREPPSPSWVVKRLALLATARQVMIERDTFVLYASELIGYREDDVSVAIRRLALRPRQQFETAFPSLGDIVEAVQCEEFRRSEHERRERENAARHEEMRSRVVQPERWFDSDEIAAGALDRVKAQYARSGFDWTEPYSPEPYEPLGV
jgi:hypothetical protein